NRLSWPALSSVIAVSVYGPRASRPQKVAGTAAVRFRFSSPLVERSSLALAEAARGPVERAGAAGVQPVVLGAFSQRPRSLLPIAKCCLVRGDRHRPASSFPLIGRTRSGIATPAY